MADVVRELVGFARALREEGIPAVPSRVRTFCEAATVLPIADLYWAGRASLVSRPEHLAVYDDVFRRYFGGEEPPDDSPEEELLPQVPVQVPRPGAGEDREQPEGDPQPSASALERLRQRSFVACDEGDWVLLTRLIAQLAVDLPRRRTRRYRRTHAGDAADLRRTLRSSRRTFGEPLRIGHRRRRVQPRRVVFLLDVSGSMSSYSRALVLFSHAVLAGGVRGEIFAFGTRLTRVTEALRGTVPGAVLDTVSTTVPDWSGGTRIGDALVAFMAEGGRDRLARGAVVVICSDGLEVGDPDVLGEVMPQLHRLAHRVVWLNPLQEDPRYEPLARGMKTALPHVDRFVSGHNLASLEDLADELARIERSPGP